MTRARYPVATIVGTGLLGASLGLGLKAHGLSDTVRGVGRRQATLDKALDRGAIDAAYFDPAEASRGADLIVLCVPAALVAPAMDAIRPVCGPDTVVTDVASTKGRICAHARATWPHPLRFVGSHPMAGSEKFGPEHASPGFYEGSVTLVEPCGEHARDAWEAVAALWRILGSRVVEVAPEQHDAVIARTSHLPHIAAACLAKLAAAGEQAGALAGRGFRDTTRIAAGRPELWRDICLTNAEAVIESLDELAAMAGQVRDAVAAGDAHALDAFFESAQQARKDVVGS